MKNQPKKSTFSRGILFAAFSYFLWGILPLYWRMLDKIDSVHILGIRILCSLLLAAIILAFNKDFKWLAAFKDFKKARQLVLIALVLTLNWGLYIWAVNHNRTIESSLGYYINPLVSIALGLIFYKEKLVPLQWAAIGLAAIGVLTQTILAGVVPWIPLILAFTFGFYGLLKKKLELTAMESLGAETLAAAPIGIFLLFFRVEWTEKLPRVFHVSLAYMADLPALTWIALACCGAITTLPLYFFARSVKLLPLSTMGFIQFLTPTIQFFLGIYIFHESFPMYRLAVFSIIWVAVVLYLVSLRRKGGMRNEE